MYLIFKTFLVQEAFGCAECSKKYLNYVADVLINHNNMKIADILADVSCKDETLCQDLAEVCRNYDESLANYFLQLNSADQMASHVKNHINNLYLIHANHTLSHPRCYGLIYFLKNLTYLKPDFS